MSTPSLLGARLLIFRLHMMLLSLVIPDLSRFLRLESLLRMFTPRAPGRLYAGLGEDRIVTLILQHLRNPWRMRGRRCLRAGLLSFYFLQLAGIPAELRFGVYAKSRPGELAHCWVTVRDRSLTEPPQEAYVPILTWPNLTSPILTSPNLTSPNLTSPNLTRRDDRQRDPKSSARPAGDDA